MMSDAPDYTPTTEDEARVDAEARRVVAAAQAIVREVPVPLQAAVVLSYGTAAVLAVAGRSPDPARQITRIIGLLLDQAQHHGWLPSPPPGTQTVLVIEPPDGASPIDPRSMH
jgi:hypothetical protein